jgi:O-antigen ligase
MLILVTGFMLSIAVRNARKPNVYIAMLFCSAIVLPIIELIYIVRSGMPLSKLAANNSRGFLNVLGMHANELGLMFNMAFALALFCFFSISGMLKKWALGIVVAILLVAIIFTFSRGAYLGLLTASAYFLYTRKKFRTILIGLLILLLAILLIPDAVLERATTGAENGDVETMSAGRVDNIWIPLLPEVMSSPIFGRGLSSILWSEAAREGTILKVGHPHSAYLGILLDTGLLGAAVIFAFFRHMWRFFTKLAKESCEPVWQGFFMGAAACVLVLMAQGLTDDRFTPTFPQTYLWLAYGMAIGMAAARRGAGADGSVPAEPINPSMHR